MFDFQNLVFVSCVAALAYKLVRTIEYWRTTKHILPHPADPTRAVPDPRFFPRHVQNRQGLWLHWQCWRDVESHGYTQPKGVVLLVHGVGDHGNRYEIVGHMFNRLGYYAFVVDHQGQGLSEGERLYVERFDHFVDDQADFLAHIRKTEKGKLEMLPTFLYGHSFGGLVAALLAERHPQLFSAVVLASPALHLDEEMVPPHLRRLSQFLSDHLPKFPIPNGDDVSMTRSAQLELFNKMDAMSNANTPVRARFGSEMLSAMDQCMKDAPTKATFPFLILHGTADKNTPISGSKLFFDAAGSSQKQFHKYEELRHDIFHDELDADGAEKDIAAFLSSWTT